MPKRQKRTSARLGHRKKRGKKSEGKQGDRKKSFLKASRCRLSAVSLKKLDLKGRGKGKKETEGKQTRKLLAQSGGEGEDGPGRREPERSNNKKGREEIR